MRLVELPGLLGSVTEPPRPNVPPALSVFNDPGEPNGRREVVGLIEGRSREDKAEPGR